VTFVLVVPIDSIAARTIDAPAERMPLSDFNTLPVIEDNAYLNLICMPQGTLAAAQINGYIKTVWG
jgi:hypothetical protein